MKVRKRILIINLAIIFLILTILSIQRTYARFVTSLSAKSYVDVGRWFLLVNNQNILANSDFSSEVTPVSVTDQDLILENLIAPSSEHYIDITINYKDVIVPFEYEITYSQDESISNEDFQLISYEIDGTSYTYNNLLTNRVVPDGNTFTQSIRLNFKWNEGEGENLNDLQDTNLSKNFDEFVYDLNIKFNQINLQT